MQRRGTEKVSCGGFPFNSSRRDHKPNSTEVALQQQPLYSWQASGVTWAHLLIAAILSMRWKGWLGRPGKCEAGPLGAP